MKNGIEIRWHGRGGQGAKTAALLLADVAFKTGQYVQGFPEYGPERMGAPITAYNRISSDQIRVHSNKHLNGYKGSVYTIDARKISVETLGKNFPNTPMLAAAAAVSGVMPREDFISEMRASYEHKFAKKPEVIEGNMKALETAYDEVAAAIHKDQGRKMSA